MTAPLRARRRAAVALGVTALPIGCGGPGPGADGATVDVAGVVDGRALDAFGAASEAW